MDISLTIDSTTKGLNLIRTREGKEWTVKSKGYVQEDEIRFIQNDWSGGFGEANFTGTDKYYAGQSIDTTHNQLFFLGPKITSATNIGQPTLCFEEFDSNLYVASTSQLYLRTNQTTMTRKWPDDWAASTAYTAGEYVVVDDYSTSTTAYVYECTTAGTSDSSEPTWGTTIDGTTSDNTVTWTCRQITDLQTFGDSLYIACGNGKYVYTSDLSTFTVSDLAQDDMDKFMVAPSNAADVASVMWGFKTPSTVYASANPKASGTAWSSYTVGDASADIINLLLMADQLLIGREDGLTYLAPDESKHPWMPELEIAKSSNNFKHKCYWQGSIYFSVGDDIGEITKSETYQLVGPYNNERITDYNITGSCCGLVADRTWVYAFMDDGTNTICFKGREKYKGNGLEWEWCPWINLSTNACDAAYVFQPSSGNAELWFGYGNTPSSVILSDYPLADTSYKLASSGYLITSWFDAGYRDWTKLLESINCECFGWDVDGNDFANLSSTISITVSYQKDDADDIAGSWTSIGTYNATNNKDMSLKKYLSTIGSFNKIRFKFALASNDNTITPVIKTTSAYGHIRPDNLKVYDFSIYCGTKDKQSETIRDFVETGRDSTGLVTLIDPLGTSHYVVFQPGYPIEKVVEDYGAKQPVVAMQVRATEVDWS